MTQGNLKIKEWRENPLQFVRELFGAEPDEWQKGDILELGRARALSGLAKRQTGGVKSKS